MLNGPTLIKNILIIDCKDLPYFSIMYNKCVVFTVYYLWLVTSARRKLTFSGDVINVKVNLSHYVPGQTLRAPGVLRLPEFLECWHKKVVKLSALCTGWQLYPPMRCLWYSFPLEAESAPGPQCGQRVKTMKNPNDTIRNWIHNLWLGV
jgi:hypothetical protein